MKRAITLFVSVAIACIGAFAQRAEISKAAERYRTATSLVTDVSQTRHNAAMTEDVVSKGNFYYKSPGSFSMVFKDTDEMLLALDKTFVMVRDGKQRTAKADGTGKNPFEILWDVFGNLISADEGTALTELADVQMAKKGGICTIIITPEAADAKVRRRMTFTSCVVTIDTDAAELRSVRINERGDNYTQYDFSNYKLNAEVNSDVFEAKAAL